MLLAPHASAEDVAAAIDRVLAQAGAEPIPAPAEPGDLVIAQVDRGEPIPDGLILAPSPAGAVVRVYPGATGHLQPELARAISQVLGGLVLAMEAAGNRDRYLLGSFLSGRTVELTVCDAGMATGPLGPAICDEDAVSERFAAWARDPDPRRLGLEGGRGLIADLSGASPEAPERPLARIAVRDGAEARPGWSRREPSPGVVILERDGDLDPDEVRSFGRPAAGIALPGGGAPFRWITVDEQGAARDGVASGHEALVTSLPAWALA
jgi:hypothetical protein